MLKEYYLKMKFSDFNSSSGFQRRMQILCSHGEDHLQIRHIISGSSLIFSLSIEMFEALNKPKYVMTL